MRYHAAVPPDRRGRRPAVSPRLLVGTLVCAASQPLESPDACPADLWFPTWAANATATQACQQWAEAEWGAQAQGNTLKEACDAWGDKYCAETCCFEEAVLSCGRDTWLPDWAGSAEEACEHWATSDWGALEGGATLQQSCEEFDGCPGTCCRYTAAKVCAVDMWLPDWSWSPTDACYEWATSDWVASELGFPLASGEGSLQDRCEPGSIGAELCAGACCTQGCVRDIWLPEWAKAAASVFACEDWAR